MAPGESCPATVTALSSVRALRARSCDCGPSTDFNLCASEREYSIEAARSPAKHPVQHRHIRGENQEADEGIILCLIDGPLHTRNSRGKDPFRPLRLRRSTPPRRPSPVHFLCLVTR